MYRIRWQGLLTGLLMLVLSLYLIITTTYPKKVNLIGDTFDYQTMAVNYAYTNMFPATGFYLPFNAYKVQLVDSSVIGAYSFKQIVNTTQPQYNFYRNPLYPFFCGIVYKIFGVHPARLYQIQFVILLLSLCAMPLLAYNLHGQKGLVSGIGAALISYVFMHKYAFEVQTQALVLPYTILLWWIINKYLLSAKSVHIIILSAYLGMGILLKNFFIPIALLAIIYRLLYRQTWLTILLPVVIIATILPYSIYVKQVRTISKQSILVTEQGNDVLLASNNEMATDGDWHPEGNESKKSYYQLPETKKLSPWKQVVSFTAHHPKLVILNLSEKIRRGLLTRWPPVLFFAVLCLLYVCTQWQSLFRYMMVVFLIIAIVFAVYIYIYQRSYFYHLQGYINDVLKSTGVTIFLPLVVVMMLYKTRLLPAIDWLIIVAGFFLLNMVFYGSERIVGVIDFIWVYYALYALLIVVNILMGRRHIYRIIYPSSPS